MNVFEINYYFLCRFLISTSMFIVGVCYMLPVISCFFFRYRYRFAPGNRSRNGWIIYGGKCENELLSRSFAWRNFTNDTWRRENFIKFWVFVFRWTFLSFLVLFCSVLNCKFFIISLSTPSPLLPRFFCVEHKNSSEYFCISEKEFWIPSRCSLFFLFVSVS